MDERMNCTETDKHYRQLLQKKAKAALNGEGGATRLDDQTPHLALAPISAYLMCRSVERQEALMEKMRAESRTMTTLTRWVMGLTVAVVVLSIVQVVVMLFR